MPPAAHAATRTRRVAPAHRHTAAAASVLLFLVAWQVAMPLLPTDLIPSPATVLRFMWDEVRGRTLAPSNVWQASAISLRRLASGLAIAFAVGLPVGLAMGTTRWIMRMLSDAVTVTLAMPFLVWALLAGLWFGMGTAAPVATAALSALPLVIVNTMEGARAVPRDLTDMARAFGVSRRQIVRHVVVPSLQPFAFAALRYGLANGWKGVLVAEIFAATSGAGWTIQYWYDAGRAQGVIGYAVFFVLFAVAVEHLVFQRLSRRVFRWRPDPHAATGRVAAGADRRRRSR